jgi:hypothetical protein
VPLNTSNFKNYLGSTLALLMTRVSANHTHNTFAANDFAITAHFFD